MRHSMLQARGIGAVVRMDNWVVRSFSETAKFSLIHVINYILANSVSICGIPAPRLFLMGHSAGAREIAGVAAANGPVRFHLSPTALCSLSNERFLLLPSHCLDCRLSF